MKTINIPMSFSTNFSLFKQATSNLSSLIGFSRYGYEYQQAIFRMLIISLTILFVCISYESINLAVAVLMFAFAATSLTTLIHTRVYPKENKNRLVIAMLLDVLGSSLAVFFTNDIGGVFLGVYLWLVIGYGLRFGRKMLLLTYIASLVGFTIASLLSSYWQVHMTAFYGLLITLIAVPLHALNLLTKLKEATYKAEAASRAKSEFLSHISHEIRTPLNGIVGACSLIEASHLGKNHAPLFGVIKNSSNVLLDLVNDVLDLATIESGKTISRVEDFYLQNLLITTTNLFEAQALQKGITVDYQIKENTPIKVHGDLLHTKQVLINLIGNAVKFTEKGSVKVIVSASNIEDQLSTVRFEVIDTGIGIAKESLPKIFESFTQAEESIKYKFGGTGLGTTISKNLVELMGGKIGIESELGVGSTFWFEIPLTLVAEDVSVENTSSEIISFKKFASNNKKKSYKVLVAEDNDTNILIISQMLKLANHQFDIVKNGELALDMLEERQYDLMILDYNMPVMGGLEALKIYQAINVGQPMVPAIILSADATENTKAEFEGMNVAAYLTKPIQLDVLTKSIEEVVSKSSKNFNDTAQVFKFDDAKKTAETNLANTNELAADTNLLNIARLDELVMISQSPAFLNNLIDGFIGDTDQNLTALKKYIKANDLTNIKEIGHAIAGSAANMGAEALRNICQIIDNLLPSDMDNIASIYNETIETYNRTRQALLDHIAHQQVLQAKI